MNKMSLKQQPLKVTDRPQPKRRYAGVGKRPPALVSPDIVKNLHTAVISIGVLKVAAPGMPKTGGYALPDFFF
jgi:hypothetical protein